MNSTVSIMPAEELIGKDELSNRAYSSLLDTYTVDYKESEYYWQVGQIDHTQGWIIHLSVIFTELPKLLELVIPELISYKVAFKIIRDPETAGHMLDGNLGFIHLGKLISIYPHEDKNAAEIAQKLIAITRGFRGPEIPTDFQLGGIVYTRYGACNPVLLEDSDGYIIKCIYNSKGELTPDPYTIPFELQNEIKWPYYSITNPFKEKRPKLLNKKYYPVSIIKPDVKGKVIRAIYFSRPWQIKYCLIKQGRQYMAMDKSGKDIRDKLKWQFELNNLLSKIIPMPKMFDLFIEYEDCYLVMDYIRGNSLHSWIKSIYNSRTWSDISLRSKITLLDKLLTILGIVDNLHKRGYIHRDITPENFLIDKNGNIVLIDLELCWSINLQKPDPPFRLGTPGFMSPEQFRTQIPTIQEDIYALGALMIVFLTNLLPTKFQTNDSDALIENLSPLINNNEIIYLINRCLSPSSDERPSISVIQSIISNYKEQIANLPTTASKLATDIDGIDIKTQSLIRSAIIGLTDPMVITPQGYWVSMMRRREEHIGNEQVQLALYKSWYTGMAGVLWVIARAKRMGYPIDNCRTGYYNTWEYILDKTSDNASITSPGLFLGKAGIALALSEGFESELLMPNRENLENLYNCFSNPSTDLTLSNGVSGYGIALLKSAQWLEPSFANNLLSCYIQAILSAQKSDGLWDCSNKKPTFELNMGQSGIILFLLAYVGQNEDQKVKQAIEKALNNFINVLFDNRTHTFKPNVLKRRALGRWSLGTGTPGIILCLIKAYKILQNTAYKEIAEANLSLLPDHPVRLDFSLNLGIVGLGEVLLEAHEAFQNPKWKKIADWIVQMLISTSQYDQGRAGSWWAIENNNNLTADISNGTGGIINFLLHHQNQQLLGHVYS